MIKKIMMVAAVVGLCGIAILYGTVNGEMQKSNEVQPAITGQENAQVKKEVQNALELPKRGKDITTSFTKQLIIDVPYGTKEEELGFREGEMDGQGWTMAPSAIDIGRNGDIYVGDPANGEIGKVVDYKEPIGMKSAIKVFSSNGKYLRMIPIPHDVDWRGDFGLDAKDNLFVLTPERVYRKEVGKSMFEPIGPILRDAWLLEVLPSGSYNVLDYSPLPSLDLRGQKFDSKGKLSKIIEQAGYDDNMLEFEDHDGNKVNFEYQSGDIKGARYKVKKDKSDKKEAVFYEPYLSEDRYYKDGKTIGFDGKGSMYALRIVAPDMSMESEDNLNGKERKTEVWVDIIDMQEGLLSSVQLEPDKKLYGDFVTHHTYKADKHGNIYQLQVDKEKARVWKYSWK